MAFSASNYSLNTLQTQLKRRLHQVVKCVVCLCLCLTLPALVLSSTVALASWQPPLTAAEQRSASALALGVATDSESAEGKTDENLQSRSGTTVIDQADLQREILLVELKHSKKNSIERIAEVFVFDYPRGVTELHRINMADNQVFEVLSIDSVHLPLNQREQQFATALLMQNKEVSQSLESEYLKSFGRTLTSLDQLDMKVSIWQPLPHQRNANPVANTCGDERCALVSIFTHDQYSFSLEPVVNLMRGTVHAGALR